MPIAMLRSGKFLIFIIASVSLALLGWRMLGPDAALSGRSNPVGTASGGEEKAIAYSGKSVAVLTSLPLFMPEALDVADRLASHAEHPLGQVLESRYAAAAHDTLQAALADDPALLMMAQARPFAPEELVRLDDWLRAGGDALIFADPLLLWHSIYPFGDARRPEGTTLLSPIFARWGLEQRIDEDQPEEPWSVRAGDYILPVTQAGHFAIRATTTGDQCQLRADGLIADCQIGKGRVLLIADADMLQPQYFADNDTASIAQPNHSEAAVISWIEALLS